MRLPMHACVTSALNAGAWFLDQAVPGIQCIRPQGLSERNDEKENPITVRGNKPQPSSSENDHYTQ
jgi:hypothetical protein